MRERLGWFLIMAGLAVLPRDVRSAIGSALSLTARAQQQEAELAVTEAWKLAAAMQPQQAMSIH